RRRLLSQEAAVKYFLLGAFASGFFLYGLALVYGATGTVRLSLIQAAVSSGGSGVLLVLGLALLIVGLMFKASVAPFHTWTPDVYQGAQTPVTAFMGACTNVAAFGAFAVLTLVRDGDGEATHLSQWAGLSKRSPLTAAVMALFLLALAGIPLTSGFTAKFAVFRAAIADGAWPLVLVGLLTSAVAA